MSSELGEISTAYYKESFVTATACGPHGDHGILDILGRLWSLHNSLQVSLTTQDVPS